MLLNAFVFTCLVKAQREENVEEIGQENIARKVRDPNMIPIIFNDQHSNDEWASINSTSDDTCSYVEQDDGSILINTMHEYQIFDYCHEYWECDDPNHQIFFKWNKVQIEQDRNCTGDWARFAWGTEVEQQEVLCTDDNDLTTREKSYRKTGSNKIVWDFITDRWAEKRWGAEAQIICKDPTDLNECVFGSHDCSRGAECINNKTGESGYTCQCLSDIKWGDQTIEYTGSGTLADPCKYIHPNFPSIEIFPVELNGETHFITHEKKWQFTWQDAFERCNELGMTLPVPSNEAEITELGTFMVDHDIRDHHTYSWESWKSFFLGVHKGNDERGWVNLYTNEPLDFEQLGNSTPDNRYNVEKVAEMFHWIQLDGPISGWRDVSLQEQSYDVIVCINIQYDDWDPADIDIGEILCETGLNECHPSSICVAKSNFNAENSTEYEYQCECSEVSVDDLHLTPISSIASIEANCESHHISSECRYTSPDLDVEVSVVTYDGKPTIYHTTEGLNFAEAVKYCAGLGMHLPVPNTEKQYHDLKAMLYQKEGPRGNRGPYWLGFTKTINNETWLNIYNDEELVIDKWRAPWSKEKDHVYMDGNYLFWWDGISGESTRPDTLCMKSELELTPDFCGENLDDCSSDATCTNTGFSYTCTCQNIELNGVVIEAASTSTGKGDDGCHYFHPNDKETRLAKVNYGDRETIISFGPAAGSTFYWFAAKCHSLGMRLLTPQNTDETFVLDQLRAKTGAPAMWTPLGVTRRQTGQWRNIYTNKRSWTNFRETSPQNYFYGAHDFIRIGSANDKWTPVDFEYDFSYSTSARTICVPPEDNETLEIDFCGTGFNDCHEGASCTNGGYNGYICECQPLQFGDVFVQPIDDAGTGKQCSYNMPGQSDKTIFPIRLGGSNNVYAFHKSSEAHLLQDAIKYCDALGMRLPLPKNDEENTAMRKVGSYITDAYHFIFWLGLSDSQNDLEYLNIYTGEEVSYTNWRQNEPRAGLNDGQWKNGPQPLPYTNVAMRRTGKWVASVDNLDDLDFYYGPHSIRTICQNDQPAIFNPPAPIEDSSNVPQYLPSLIKNMNKAFQNPKWTKFSKRWTDLSEKFNDKYFQIAEKGCTFSKWLNLVDIDAITCKVSNSAISTLIREFLGPSPFSKKISQVHLTYTNDVTLRSGFRFEKHKFKLILG